MFLALRLSLFIPDLFFRTLLVSSDRNPDLNNYRNLFRHTAETPREDLVLGKCVSKVQTIVSRSISLSIFWIGSCHMLKNRLRSFVYQCSNLSRKMIFPCLSAEKSQWYLDWPGLDMLNAKPITPINVAREHPRPGPCAYPWSWQGWGLLHSSNMVFYRIEGSCYHKRGEWCLMDQNHQITITPTHVFSGSCPPSW